MRNALLIGLCLVLFAAPAVAHTSYVTPDENIRIVVGNLNEPITTYVKTGLDLHLYHNDAGRTPLSGVQPGAMRAILIAPDNTTMEQDLQFQHGSTHKYTFSKPYTLTVPGQYVLRLSGTINGTAVAADINVAGPVESIEASAFPTPIVANDVLATQIADLESTVADLETRLAAAESKSKSLPGPGLPILLAAIAAVALAATRRHA